MKISKNTRDTLDVCIWIVGAVFLIEFIASLLPFALPGPATVMVIVGWLIYQAVTE